MAELKPKKIDLTLINNGQQYKSGDGIQPNAINDPIQASAYVQALVETQPDVSGAGSYGTPSVTISDASGTPQFIFRNLRGAGIANIAQSGEPGNSGTAYIITLDNGNKFSITAPRGHQGIQGIQGVSISSVVQTEKSTESSGKNVVTVNKTDGTSSDFTVYNGEKGDTGAQITGYEFLGEDKNGGYVYKLIFDNGVSVEFTAPKGNKGDKGDKGDTYTLTGADMVKIAQVTAPFAEPYIDEVVENEIQEQMVEATKGFTVIENVSNLVENNISFTKNYVSYNKLNDYVTLRLVGTANSLNATSSVNVATMSNVFAPNAETQKEVSVGGIKTIVSVGTDGSIIFTSTNMLSGDFDVEITWGLPSDSIIGQLQLNNAETVNINSVVRKGDITTINLNATFVHSAILVGTNFNGSSTVFYVSDAFNIRNREFVCECTCRTANWIYNGSVPFSIINGECRAAERPSAVGSNATYLTAIHNLQLKFDTSIPNAEISFLNGDNGTISNIGSTADKEYVSLSIRIQISGVGDKDGQTVTLGSIDQAYAPIDVVQVAISRLKGYMSIQPTGLITLYVGDGNTINSTNETINVTYKYR